MNALPTSAFWLQSLGLLALQAATLLLAAGLAQTLVRAARWRRAVWLAALTGLALMLANALAGLDRHVSGWFTTEPKPAPQFIVRANLPVESGPTVAGAEATELVPSTRAAAALHAGQPTAPAGVWWPAWLWLGGALAIGLWALTPRLWLAFAARQADVSLSSDDRARLNALARRLNLRRPVRVLVSARLAGPIAFGVLRPGIGLPADFWTANSRAEQDAMLAHELAHHAARDPLWLALADLLLAALWWHPLVWWARRQFRAASEAAADEASLVVENGPVVLAGSLVALASRLQRRGLLSLLGMAGFRSGLGRRVERLLRLRAGGRPAVGRIWPGVFVAIAGLASLGVAVAVSAWLFPAQAASRPALLAVMGEALTPTPATQNTVVVEPTTRIPASTAEAKPASPDNSAAELPRAVLRVQLPQEPGIEPKRVREISMDAITRRIEWLVSANRVRCEPVGETQIRVVLTGPEQGSPGGDGFADLLPRVKRLIEQPGRLEFRRVHPESDELVRRNTCPEGYEVLPQMAKPGAWPARWVVARDAAPGLGHTNLVEASLVRDPFPEHPRIAITFDPSGSKRFAAFTEASIGQRIAVVLDDQVLLAPVVGASITGGKCEISSDISEHTLREIVAALVHPLPWKLTVVAVTETAKQPASETEPASQPRVAALVQDAKLLAELGHLDEAKAKLEAALKLEPDNQAALNYLKRVNEAETSKTLPHGDAKAEPTQLYTRTFKVEPRTLAAGLESFAGKGWTNLTAAEQLRWLFVSAGLEFAGTNAAPADAPPAKALFYNDRNGLVLVRATAAELQTVEQLLQVLNTAPPQVVIEAKFVEVTEDASRALGFDWFLGSVRTSTNASGIASPPGSTGGVATLTGILTDPQFREAVAALRLGGTNGVRELRGDQLDWPGRDATNAAGIRVNAALGTSLTGVLTDAQYRVLLRALEQREGVDVLSAPRVTTLSGRQAQIQVVDTRSVLTGINPLALVQPGAPVAAGTVPFLTSTIPTGPTLDIIPTVAADGYTLELNVFAGITDFLGYDQPPAEARVNVWQDGQVREVAVPLPRFRVRQMQTHAALRDGQTLVLGGLLTEKPVKDQTGEPRPDSRPARKQLLVFVTATIIDPAGNRVHTPDNPPFDPNRVPPQPQP
jgi:type II secretory pathway component GspD/PulD (secretin)